MANRPQDATGTQDPKRPHTSGSPADADVSKQQQREARQAQRQPQRTSEDRENPDQVEIGDPVPEDDRTIRSRETGEDEDLPGESRRGETGEDEDLPDDDAGIERPGGRH